MRCHKKVTQHKFNLWRFAYVLLSYTCVINVVWPWNRSVHFLNWKTRIPMEMCYILQWHSHSLPDDLLKENFSDCLPDMKAKSIRLLIPFSIKMKKDIYLSERSTALIFQKIFAHVYFIVWHLIIFDDPWFPKLQFAFWLT